MRQGWTVNGQHFTRTSTERGGGRHFIDGKPVREDDWHQEMSYAKNIERGLAFLAAEQGDPR